MYTSQMDTSRESLVMDEKGKISKCGKAGAGRFTTHKMTGGHAMSMLAIGIRLHIGEKGFSTAVRRAELQEIESVSIANSQRLD
jgi:hypothetical protein